MSLRNQALIPFLEKHITPFYQNKTILPQTPFVEALKLAFAKGDFQIKTKENIKSVLDMWRMLQSYAGLIMSRLKESNLLYLNSFRTMRTR